MTGLAHGDLERVTMIEPSFADFEAHHEAGGGVLSMRLVGDLETPVSAYLKLSAGRSGGSFLLKSVEGGGARPLFDDRP